MWWNFFMLFTCCVPVLAFSVPIASASDTGYELFEAPYDMGLEVPFAEWDWMEEAYWPLPLCEWQGDEETALELASEQSLREIGKDSAKERSEESQGTAESAEEKAPDPVQFVKPMTPEEFVERWEEQKRLFLSLPRPLSPKQRSMLRYSYYPFTTAGRLLEELGRKKFLKRFGGSSINQMRTAAAAEFKQRAVVEEHRNVAIGEVESKTEDEEEKEHGADIVKFLRPKTPRDFARHWAEQKCLFQSLPRPLTPEQKRILYCTYYQFTMAGRLLEELGQKTFLKKFGRGTIDGMRKAVTVEIRQRMAVKREEEIRAMATLYTSSGEESDSDLVAILDASGEKESNTDLAAFTRPKTPKEFVERWPEQRRLFQSLPRPLTPEQRYKIRCNYYPFTAAGQLLDELGKRAFMKKFGRGSATRMRKDAVAAIKQRRTGEGGREMPEEAGNKRVGEEEEKIDTNIVASTRPKTPEDFVGCWPRQKRMLDSTYYQLTTAGRLLEEFGKEAFLEKFGEGTVAQIRKNVTAEMKQRTATGENPEVTEEVEDVKESDLDLAATLDTSGGKDNESDLATILDASEKDESDLDASAKEGDSDITIFVRPTTPQEFVECWSEQKRLFQSLRRPLSSGQLHALRCAYYPFAPAGRLFKELGEEEFLKGFGRGTAADMQEAVKAEARQRRANKADRDANGAASGEYGKNAEFAAFVRPKTPKEFVEQWPEQKRLFESLPHHRTPEQNHELKVAYYPFVAAGRLLEELGEKAFLKTFGKDTVSDMQEAARAERRKRRANERDQRMVEAASGIDGRGPVLNGEDGKGLDLAVFVKPKTPEDFVQRWPEQKRLFESLPRSRTPEQRRVLEKVFYKFKAAGRLLEELGEEAFMKRFGRGTVTRMRKGVLAEFRRRRTGGEDQIVDKSVGNVKEEGASTETLASFKSPRDFVKRWAEQKLLLWNIPYRRSSAQTHVLECTYYQFVAAERLLEELGEEKFLERFGGGTMEQMQQDTMAEVKQRADGEGLTVIMGLRNAKAAEKRQNASDIAALVAFQTPKDFAERWAEQKRLVQSLPRPLAPKQNRVLNRMYYRFAVAGRLLEELGKEEFLQWFGEGTINQMQRATAAENRRRRVIEEEERQIAEDWARARYGLGSAAATGRPERMAKDRLGFRSAVMASRLEERAKEESGFGSAGMAGQLGEIAKEEFGLGSATATSRLGERAEEEVGFKSAGMAGQLGEIAGLPTFLPRPRPKSQNPMNCPASACIPRDGRFGCTHAYGQGPHEDGRIIGAWQLESLDIKFAPNPENADIF